MLTHTFPELVIGDVLVAPFVTYTAIALALFLILRPLRQRFISDQIFSSPPIADLSIFILILATIIVLF